MTYVPVSPNGDLAKIFAAPHLVYLASSQDDTALVLRAQLIAEECSALWVSKFSAAPGKLGRIGFAQKLMIARHLGLPDDLAAPMKTLNDMRNDMAHEINKSEIDLDRLSKMKMQVEAIRLPPGTPMLENPIQIGMPRDGVTLYYSDPTTTARQRLAIIFDAFLVRFIVVWQTAVLAAGKTITI